MVFGDSLSAAYGISQKEGWVALLQERLRRNGFDYTVVNASISGETTSGGASRLAAIAKARPDIFILGLGSNDGLRGLPVKQMQDNLRIIIQAAQKAGSQVLLLGMRLPPNYGPAYVNDFENAFRELARQHKVALVPFLLEGVADRRQLFQDDQLHPTAAAQPVLLEVVWKSLLPMLRK
jgi:acyl-CoA thioesterase I